MELAGLHASPELNLPLRPELGAVVLAVGLVVLVVISYDIYRQHWVKG